MRFTTSTQTQPAVDTLNASETALLEFHSSSFSIQFVPQTQTVVFRGELKLCTVAAYTPMLNVLNAAASQSPARLYLDFQDLRFLNSSGICTLLRFVLKIHNEGRMQIVVKGSKAVSWHSQSLQLFKRVMPQLDLQFKAD